MFCKNTFDLQCRLVVYMQTGTMIISISRNVVNYQHMGMRVNMFSDSPDRVISRTQVDEEIPGPIPHGQQVLHALQVHGEQAGTTPYCRHAPRCDPDVRILVSESHHLPVQVVGSLWGEKKETGSG